MELIVHVGNECKILRIHCCHRKNAISLFLERCYTLLAVNAFTGIHYVKIRDYRAFLICVSACQIIDVLAFRQLTH